MKVQISDQQLQTLIQQDWFRHQLQKDMIRDYLNRNGGIVIVDESNLTMQQISAMKDSIEGEVSGAVEFLNAVANDVIPYMNVLVNDVQAKWSDGQSTELRTDYGTIRLIRNNANTAVLAIFAATVEVWEQFVADAKYQVFVLKDVRTKLEDTGLSGYGKP